MAKLKPSLYMSILVIFLFVFSLITFIFESKTHAIPVDVFVWGCIWLICGTISTILATRYFSVGFLLGLFSLFIAWRILELHHFKFVSLILNGVFFLLLIQFIHWVWKSCHDCKIECYKNKMLTWQLTFIRIYVGLDFIPHFTEKLFAGYAIRVVDIHAFMNLGLSHADFLVWLAGLCEFAAAFSLACGFMLRLGAFGATLYLLIATYLGNHFALGFIWVNHGGGWEFSIMWATIIFSFGLTGAHHFSLDQCLEDRYRLPSFVRYWL